MIDRRFPIALVCTLLLAASVPGLAVAQEDEPEPVIYGVYLQCEPAQAARASELIRELSLIHISEPTRRRDSSRMPSSA